MAASVKYPRTPHLPNSPGMSDDDRRIETLAGLLTPPGGPGVLIVASEKLDGSNVCLTAKNVFARSHGGAPRHPSFDALKALHARLRWQIPDGLSIFGEWCWAVHSIEYEALPDPPLFIFGVRDDARQYWSSWDDVRQVAYDLGLQTPPWRDAPFFSHEAQLLQFVVKEAKRPSAFGGPREGVVLRRAAGFPNSEFDTAVAKWVRKGHVTSTEHWTNMVIKRQKTIRA